jgi:hypothetical protein
VKKIEGGCHCGAVRYALAGPPTHSMICHCRTCRGVSGAPVLAWVSVASADLSFVAGAPQTYRSSPGVVRRFCGRCGTQLAYALDAEPESVDVTTMSLDRPEDHPPTHHSWTSHDVAWSVFDGSLPRFPKSRPAGGA